MTNEEAIELLKNAVPQDESLDEEGLFIEAVNMAIKALEKAETNCPEIPDSWIPCSERLPEKEAAPKWIPVTTNPPKEEKSYLVWLDCGSVCECRWTDGDYLFGKPTGVWRWNFIDIPRYTKILAWMPLPEPWEGEADEQK